jgi:hypothetical protein
MANIATYLANKLLDHAWGVTSYTEPTTYLALYTVAPTSSGGGTEVSGGSYARQALAGLIAAASAAANSNSSAINFPTATGSWGAVVAVGVLDAATSGNLLMFGNLTTSKTIGSGDTFSIPIGSLTDALS